MPRKPLSDKPMQGHLSMRFDEDLLATFSDNYDHKRRRQIIEYAIIKANMQKNNEDLEYLNLHEDV
jgi:hypothetical protein